MAPSVYVCGSYRIVPDCLSAGPLSNPILRSSCCEAETGLKTVGIDFEGNGPRSLSTRPDYVRQTKLQGERWPKKKGG